MDIKELKKRTLAFANTITETLTEEELTEIFHEADRTRHDSTDPTRLEHLLNEREIDFYEGGHVGINRHNGSLPEYEVSGDNGLLQIGVFEMMHLLGIIDLETDEIQ